MLHFCLLCAQWVNVLAICVIFCNCFLYFFVNISTARNRWALTYSELVGQLSLTWAPLSGTPTCLEKFLVQSEWWSLNVLIFGIKLLRLCDGWRLATNKKTKTRLSLGFIGTFIQETHQCKINRNVMSDMILYDFSILLTQTWEKVRTCEPSSSKILIKMWTFWIKTMNHNYVGGKIHKYNKI